MSPEKDYEEKGQLGALNRQDALDDYVRIRLGMPQSDHLSIRGRFRRGIMGQSKKKLRRIKALTGSASWPSIVGAAFFWIWMDRVMFGDTLLPDAASSAEHEALAWLAPLVILVSSCVALLLIVVALVRGNDDELWRWRMFAVCAAIGVVGGVAVTGGYLGSATPVCLAGCCLVGGAMAPLIILWGRVATAQGTQKTLTHISGAWALGLAGNLLLEGLLPVAAALSVGLMPLLSFAGYYVLFRLQGKATFRIPVEATAEVDSSCGRKSAKERLLGIRPSFSVYPCVLLCFRPHVRLRVLPADPFQWRSGYGRRYRNAGRNGVALLLRKFHQSWAEDRAFVQYMRVPYCGGTSRNDGRCVL